MSSTRSESLLLHGAAQLITPRPNTSRRGYSGQLRVVSDGAVFIEDGRIVEAGPTNEVRRNPRVRNTESLDASACVIAPGFVDSHTHLVFAATRQEEYEMRIRGAGYEAIAAAGGGIRNSVRRLRDCSEGELFEKSRRWCQLFLEHGTTTLEAKSGYGLSVESELKILRVLRRLRDDPTQPLEIVPTLLGAHEIPDEYRDRPSVYVDLICEEMIPQVAEERLAEFCDVFCEAHVFTVEQARKILTAAKRHGLKVKIHADQLTRNGGARLAVELGATSADHLEHISEDDISLLADSSVTATLLPGASFHLGMKQFAPGRRLWDSGARVALATDFNPGTSPSVNMQIILSMACSELRLTPAEAFIAATAGGAQALDRQDQIGSLGPGQQADLVIFDVDDYRRVPYHFGMNLVRGVIKKGRVLFFHPSRDSSFI